MVIHVIHGIVRENATADFQKDLTAQVPPKYQASEGLSRLEVWRPNCVAYAGQSGQEDLGLKIGTNRRGF